MMTIRQLWNNCRGWFVATPCLKLVKMQADENKNAPSGKISTHFAPFSTLNRKMKSYKLPLSKFRNCREHSNFMITHNKMYMWARTYMIMDNEHMRRDFFKKTSQIIERFGQMGQIKCGVFPFCHCVPLFMIFSTISR